MGDLISFTAYAAAHGHAIAEPPRPPVSTKCIVTRPNGSAIGVGYVVAHLPDRTRVVVSVNGVRHVVSCRDCRWSERGASS